MAGKHRSNRSMKGYDRMLVISVSWIPFPALCIQSKFWLEWKAWPLEGLSGPSAQLQLNFLPLYLLWVSLLLPHVELTGIQCSGHQECYVQTGQQRMQTYFTHKKQVQNKFLKIPRKQQPNVKLCSGPLECRLLQRHRSQAREVSLGSQQTVTESSAKRVRSG